MSRYLSILETGKVVNLSFKERDFQISLDDTAKTIKSKFGEPTVRASSKEDFRFIYEYAKDRSNTVVFVFNKSKKLKKIHFYPSNDLVEIMTNLKTKKKFFYIITEKSTTNND